MPNVELVVKQKKAIGRLRLLSRYIEHLFIELHGMHKDLIISCTWSQSSHTYPDLAKITVPLLSRGFGQQRSAACVFTIASKYFPAY